MHIFSGISRRIVTFPVDVYSRLPMDTHWSFPMQFHNISTYIMIDMFITVLACTIVRYISIIITRLNIIIIIIIIIIILLLLLLLLLLLVV